MNKYPKLNLPSVKLRAARRADGDYVWDEVRGCWLLLTPEEWVRRHVLAYLCADRGFPAVRLIQEYPVSVEGMPQRADIVVVDSKGIPQMVVECKCPDVKIDAAVFDQAVRYNSVLKARHLMLTNGLKHYFYRTDDGVNYVPLDAFPEL